MQVCLMVFCHLTLKYEYAVHTSPMNAYIRRVQDYNAVSHCLQTLFSVHISVNIGSHTVLHSRTKTVETKINNLYSRLNVGIFFSVSTMGINLLFIRLSCSCTGGADVLYNKFNVTSLTPPENPPSDTNSNYSCVAATSDKSWRLSRCTDKHRVVCQSGYYQACTIQEYLMYRW